ncbi:MAG: hypothetical protein H6Q32_978, partial [Bacteroidetes bacterium]|nr:hypothetical protein [Bacteroidota bacterium]
MADIPVTPTQPGLEPAKPLPLFRRMQTVPFVLVALAIVFFLYQIVAGGVTLLLAGGSITANTIDWVRWSTLIGQLLFLLGPTLVLT